MSFFSDAERKALYEGVVASVELALRTEQHEQLSLREQLIVATVAAALIEVDGSIAAMLLRKLYEKKVEDPPEPSV